MDPSSASATLSASVTAAERSPDDQAVLDKARSTAFYSLATLRAALRIAAEPKSLLNEPQGPKWLEACRAALEEAIMSKSLVANTALRFWLVSCLEDTFTFSSVSHHLYGTVKAFIQVAIAKNSPSSCRTCVIAALGSLFREHGGRLASLSSDIMSACARQLPLRDLALRKTAMECIRDALHGIGSSSLPDSITADVLKAISVSSKDKAPEVRGATACALATLALNSPGGVSSSASTGSATPPVPGAVPLETTLALCVKGLEDPSIQVKLSYADTVAALLSVGVDDHASAAAARAKDASRVDKAEAAEDAKVKDASRGSFDKAFKTFTRTSTDKKRGDGSFTLQSAVGHLCALFTRANTRSQRAGTVAAMVALLKLQMTTKGLDIGIPENAWIISSIISLLGSPKWGPADNTAACAGVAYVIRGGIAVHASEQQQTWLLAELLKLNGSEWQLQVVLSEASHLTTALGAAVLPLAQMLKAFCWKCLDHREYSVRFEAATTLAALLRACPNMSLALVSQALKEMMKHHAELVEVSTPKQIDPKDKVAEAEKKKAKMFSLHGRATAITICVQGVQGLASSLPLKKSSSNTSEFSYEVLVEAAMTLIEREFDPKLSRRETMGVLCTCVRAGWYLMSACFCFGESSLFKLLKPLIATWKRSLDRVSTSLKAAQAKQPTSFEPTHELVCLDASLGCLLSLVRSSPQLFFKEPVVLSHLTSILRKILDLVRPGKGKLATHSSVQTSKQGKFRLNLVSAELLETYAWLPPGSYPNQAEVLCQMACEIFLSSSNDEWVESAMLPALLNADDTALCMQSSYHSSHHSSVDIGGLDALTAMQAQLSGVPLENIERELAVYSPSWSPLSIDDGASGGGFGGGFGDTFRDDVGVFGPASVFSQQSLTTSIDKMACSSYSSSASNYQQVSPTPLHGANWRLPPPPSSRLEIRLLDACVLVMAATFACQDDNYQACLVGAFVELLNEKAAVSTFGSVLASDDDRRKREKKQRIIQHNVVTALLAILKSLPSHADSEMNVTVPWVVSTHGSLLSMLKSNSDDVRRASGEGLALLATKMGTMYQAQLLQQLVELLRCAPGGDTGYMGRRGSIGASLSTLGVTESAAQAITGSNTSGGAGGANASANSNGGGTSEIDLLCAGTVFALACLKRSAPAIEAGGFWHELETQLGASGSPSVKSWSLYALTIVARSLDLGLAHQARVRNMLQGMASLLEVHFLGAWGFAGSAMGNPYEVSMLVSLIKLTETMIPMIQSLAPNQSLVSKFEACCFGIVDILPFVGQVMDPRIHYEVLQAADLLSTFRPSHAQSESVVFDYTERSLALCRFSLSHPLETSPAVLSLALKCTSRLMRANPKIIAAERLDTLLLSCLSTLIGASTCPRCSTWRGLFVARRVENHHSSRRHCAILNANVLYQACLLDCSLTNTPRRPVHWLLLARGLVVSTATAAGAAAGVGVTVAGEEEGDDSEEEEHVEEFTPANDYKAICGETLNVAVGAVAACTFSGSPRWQLRWVSLFTARLALKQAMIGEEALYHRDVKSARDKVQAMLPTGDSSDSFGSFDAFGSSPKQTCASYDEMCDFTSLHLESVISTACSASTFILGDDLGLNVLQRLGLLLLGDVVKYFTLTLDPDVLEEGVQEESILKQFTSQINSSMKPSLALRDAPSLVSASAEVLVLAISNGLITDPTRLKRLISALRPSSEKPDHNPQCFEDALTTIRPQPLANSSPHIILEDHIVRLVALAHICVIGDKKKNLTSESVSVIGSVPPDIIDQINKNFLKDSIAQQWAAVIADAMRIKNSGKGIPSSNVLSAYALKGRTRQLVLNNWQVVAAAYALCQQNCPTFEPFMSTLSATCLLDLMSSETASIAQSVYALQCCLTALSHLLFGNETRCWEMAIESQEEATEMVQGPPTSSLKPLLLAILKIGLVIRNVDLTLKQKVMSFLNDLFSSKMGTFWVKECLSAEAASMHQAQGDSTDNTEKPSLWSLIMSCVTLPLTQCLSTRSCAHDIVIQANPSHSLSENIAVDSRGTKQQQLEIVAFSLKNAASVVELCPEQLMSTSLEPLLAYTSRAILSICFIDSEDGVEETSLNYVRAHGLPAISVLCQKMCAHTIDETVTDLSLGALTNSFLVAALKILANQRQSSSSASSALEAFDLNAFKLCIEAWVLVMKSSNKVHRASLDRMMELLAFTESNSLAIEMKVYTAQSLRSFLQYLLQQPQKEEDRILVLFSELSPFCLGLFIDVSSKLNEDAFATEVLALLLKHHSSTSTAGLSAKLQPILALLLSASACVLKKLRELEGSETGKLRPLLGLSLTHLASTSSNQFREGILALSADLQLELKLSMKEHLEKSNGSKSTQKKVAAPMSLKKIDMSQYNKK